MISVSALKTATRSAAAVLCTLVCPALLLAGEERSPGEGSGFRGLLAIQGDRVLASENADRLFTPASVNKLVVAAAALHHLGPEHRIVTRVRAGGPTVDAALSGDLILEAAGDPTWSERFRADGASEALDMLAKQLADRGIRSIAGNLVVDLTRFPGRPFPASRPASEYAYGYAAPTSGVAVDENAVKVEISPGPRVGSPAKARLLFDGKLDSPHVINRMTTVSKERHGVGTVDFLPVWEDETIVVRGEYPITEPSYVIDLSVPSPELHAARRLKNALTARGVVVRGDVRLAKGLDKSATKPGGGDVLARFESPSLVQILNPILTDSRNWHAEMLMRVLALAVEGTGRRDEGLKVTRRFLEQTVGCSPGASDLDDASGLSPYNLITPRCVVELLRFVQKQPWRAAFVSALAQNGEGTLEVWNRLPPVAAKTGSIRHTLALAGYLDPTNPEPVLFAVFFNQQPGGRGPQRAEITGLLKSWRSGTRDHSSSTTSE